MLPCALDDRGAHDRKGKSVRLGELLRCAFPHGLGERVDVGPPQRLRASPPVFHKAPVHPLAPAFLSRRSHLLRARSPVLTTGGCGEAIEHLGPPRGFVRGRAGPIRRLALGPPVDPVLEGLLGNDAFGQPCNVRRGHVDEVRPAPARQHRLVQAHRPGQIALERLVDRRIERDVGGAVEHHVEI